MSKVNSFHELPIPASSVRGSNHHDRGDLKPSNVARFYRPRGVPPEPEVATVSRFAGRLIDRLTGEAYSADQFQAMILAQTSKRSPGTPVYATFAKSSVITMANLPADGDEMSVVYNGVVAETYVFRDAATLPNEIEIGESIAEAITAIAGITSGTIGVATTAEPDEISFEVSVGGVVGNDHAVSFSNPDIFGTASVPLSGGVDTTLATAGDELFDEDFLYIALIDITLTDADAGWYKIALTPL